MTLSRHPGFVPVLARCFSGEPGVPAFLLLDAEVDSRRRPLRARPPFTRL